MPVNSMEECEDMVARASIDAQTFVCRDGYYFRWRSDDGAELWIYTDRSMNLLSVTPYFRGKSRINAVLMGDVDVPGYGPGEGAVRADPLGEDGRASGLPIVFDVVDRARLGSLGYPFRSPVQLSAFAHQLRVWASREEYCAEGQGRTTVTVNGIQYTAGVVGPHADEPFITFSGQVLDSATYVNPLFGKPYQWALVSMGFETRVDVVCEPALVDTPIVAGGMVVGKFWLCGHISEPRARGLRDALGGIWRKMA
jgi:hypothetical protein